MGDGHSAIHGADYTAYPRGHLAWITEGHQVLPNTTMGDVTGVWSEYQQLCIQV